MTLRLQPSLAPDQPQSPLVLQVSSRRDPRAAIFVLGLVAASPSDRSSALTAFADRLAQRRSGQR